MSVDLSTLKHIEPNNEIKLALFDVDGTLLDKEGHYSQSLKRELLRIQSKGIKTAIASGRPTFAAQFLMDELHIKDPGVFCTGAHIYDPVQCQSLSVTAIDSEQSTLLLEALRKLDIYYELYTESQFYLETDFAPHIRDVHAYHLRCKPHMSNLLSVIKQEAVLKFLIGVDQTTDQKLLMDLERQFPKLTFAYACLPAYPTWKFASVIDQKACKKNAFNFLLELYNLQPKNVISFGDAQSDKFFLQMAGVGVAMGNAQDDIKAVANYITRPAWEDGVAYALSRLL